MATRFLQVRSQSKRGRGFDTSVPRTHPLVVLHRIEKLTELIADLRQPPIVESSDGSTDARHQPLATPDCTQMSESQFANISLLDLRVRN